MSTPVTVTPPTINLTDSAARKIHQLIEEEKNLSLMLRVFVTGGGCSGFQYGFSFDENTGEDDTVITKAVEIDAQDDEDSEDEGGTGRSGTVKLLIDAISYPYLVGAKIDYKEDIDGKQFIITNPNASTTCGCGSSFSV